MALLTLQEARDALRLEGTDNDTIIQPLVDALPDYMQATTGSAWDDEKAAGYNLAKTCAKFILQLWYNADISDAEKLQAVIDRLLGTLAVMARSNTGGGTNG